MLRGKINCPQYNGVMKWFKLLMISSLLKIGTGIAHWFIKMLYLIINTLWAWNKISYMKAFSNQFSCLDIVAFYLKVVLRGPVNYTPASVLIMAWRRRGDGPLFVLITTHINTTTHICVGRPEWVKSHEISSKTRHMQIWWRIEYITIRGKTAGWRGFARCIVRTREWVGQIHCPCPCLILFVESYIFQFDIIDHPCPTWKYVAAKLRSVRVMAIILIARNVYNP